MPETWRWREVCESVFYLFIRLFQPWRCVGGLLVDTRRGCPKSRSLRSSRSERVPFRHQASCQAFAMDEESRRETSVLMKVGDSPWTATGEGDRGFVGCSMCGMRAYV